MRFLLNYIPLRIHPGQRDSGRSCCRGDKKSFFPQLFTFRFSLFTVDDRITI